MTESRIDISICIPTRNRADFLRRCLTHISAFTAFSYEVVVTDNASTEETAAAVDSFRGRISRLTYRRHVSDLGFSRNVDGALRLAQGRYIYLLSDDDIVFENGLEAMKFLLDTNRNAVAVGGPYMGASEQSVGMRGSYAEAKVVTLRQGDHGTLFRNLMLCDAHPLMRRELYQRHCRFDQYGFGLLPLYARLLRFGDICFIDKPLFQHVANPESLTTKMSEPWFIDFCMSDLERAFLATDRPLPPALLQGARDDFIRILHLNTARVSGMGGDLIKMWRYLKRAKTVGGIDEICRLKCERQFLPEVAIRRFRQILSDMRVRTVATDGSDILDAVRVRLSQLMPLLEWRRADEPHDVFLVQCYSETPAGMQNSPQIVALLDVIDTLRLTIEPLALRAGNGTFELEFSDSDAMERSRQNSHDYQVLTARYGDVPSSSP